MNYKTNEFIKKANIKHYNYYGYIETQYINSKQKLTIKCPIHGAFLQTPSDHLSGCGCQKCGIYKNSINNVSNKKTFVEKSQVAHPDKYDYSKSDYINNHTKIIIICPIHGEFFKTPNVHVSQKQGCIKCALISRSQLNTLKFSEFVTRSNLVHKNFYLYNESDYINSTGKTRITCPIHGDFYQTAIAHYSGKQGCLLCGIIKRNNTNTLSTEQFIIKAVDMYSDLYDYSKSIYTNSKKQLIIVCNIHGEFFVRPNDFLSGHACQKCSVRNTKFELNIKKFLDKYNIEYIENDRKILSGLELDFYLPTYRIAIECNGLFWHSETMGKYKDYHLNKTELCSAKNIKLIHLFEDELEFKSKIIYSYLKFELNLIKSNIDASECIINAISSNIKSKFLNKYNILGDIESDINLGLFYRNRLVSVIALKDNNLLRFTAISNFNIFGAKLKFLKYINKSITVNVDRRFSTGGSYFNLGFKLKDVILPRCWGVMGHYRVEDVELGRHKIWDCGNLILDL